MLQRRGPSFNAKTKKDSQPMTTLLHKPVKRKTHEQRFESGKRRAIIVTLHPAGYIGFRLEGTRREETMPIEAAWERAVKMRLALETTERLKRKAEKAGVSYAYYMRRTRRSARSR
jgi:hypothetical protein